MLDIAIRGGTIVDGTGKEKFLGDVGIKDGKIVEIGPDVGPAERTLDATGSIVTPGFVDIHTHYDGQVSWDSLMAPSSINGVTSVVMGNCGVGFAPAKPNKHDWLIALLEGVEDIPGTALAEGLAWNWQTFPEYLDAIEARDYAVDIGAHMPHAALRAYVMGDRGGDHKEEPTPAEIEQMEALITEALDAGAVGFRKQYISMLLSRDGGSIGTLTAPAEELMAAARAIRDHGKGVIQLISDAYLTADDDFASRELDLIEMLAKVANSRLSFTVQQTDDAPDRWRMIFDRIENMVGKGLNVRGQVGPRPIGLIMSFSTTTNPFYLTPTWRRLAKLPLAERLAAVKTPEIRKQMITEHREDRRTGLIETITRGFDRMYRMTDPVDYEPSPEDSLAADAERLGKEVDEHIYDVLLEEGGTRLIYGPAINFSYGNLSDVHSMISHEYALYALSDAGAHCATICDGSFPTTSLGLWSRGNKAGQTVSVEKLVHGYTQRNAVHVGWHDRGVLAPGYLADLNIIDLDALDLPPPEIIADLPAGGTRLLQTPRGYRATIKSGQVTFENGQSTGLLPGGLLRGEQTL
ncbi:MAG: amidohydrolase family protein [Proteobacteria bacterium]|nr:amidohydrolase family protein [Pseudomonadota bacterium]